MWNLEDTLGFIVVSVLLVGIAGLPLFLALGFGEVVAYHFNKSTCSVSIDYREVYNGRCHFVTVESIGENGNTKRVIIYKDSRRWRPQQVYVTDNVMVTESN